MSRKASSAGTGRTGQELKRPRLDGKANILEISAPSRSANRHFQTGPSKTSSAPRVSFFDAYTCAQIKRNFERAGAMSIYRFIRDASQWRRGFRGRRRR
jgi:hypothetical protein